MASGKGVLPQFSDSVKLVYNTCTPMVYGRFVLSAQQSNTLQYNIESLPTKSLYNHLNTSTLFNQPTQPQQPIHKMAATKQIFRSSSSDKVTSSSNTTRNNSLEGAEAQQMPEKRQSSWKANPVSRGFVKMVDNLYRYPL
jgi:hypothetical protein